MADEKSLNFIEEIIEKDIADGLNNGRIQTRFPPEPNGYLHIGHAKSICLNFGLAKKYNGKCNLRFDDTNPTTEETEYVESIKKDIEWLGFKWDNEFYASDYFEKIYDFAVTLIKKGSAYVDDSTPEEIAATKGSINQPGSDSPYRSRSIEDNLRLFEEMRDGKYEDGAKVLRAKIDMSHDNLLMRDPVIYRIKHAHHHRTGNKWCLYPMYDFAHGESDSIEKITHSICTLEFIHHRPLYNWFIEQLGIFPSRQYEFARLNLTYTVMSKRKLLKLVNEGYVTSWDDPRMPTLSGMRRRGYPPEAIRNLCDTVGVAKRENMIDLGLLEFHVREHLNKVTDRVMAVLDPVKLIITNYEETGDVFEIENNPETPNGTRSVPFSKELWIEREDFMEDAPKKFFRLSPGNMVRLKGAYIVKCEGCNKDENGNVTEVLCTYLPESKSGNDTSGLSVKGTIHWVSVAHAATAEVRVYDRLFKVEDPSNEDGDFKDYINPDALKVLPLIYIEPALADAKPGDSFQFIRKGYFCADTDSTPDKLIFNYTATLADTWGKEKEERVGFAEFLAARKEDEWLKEQKKVIGFDEFVESLRLKDAADAQKKTMSVNAHEKFLKDTWSKEQRRVMTFDEYIATIETSEWTKKQGELLDFKSFVAALKEEDMAKKERKLMTFDQFIKDAAKKKVPKS